MREGGSEPTVDRSGTFYVCHYHLLFEHRLYSGRAGQIVEEVVFRATGKPQPRRYIVDGATQRATRIPRGRDARFS